MKKDRIDNLVLPIVILAISLPFIFILLYHCINATFIFDSFKDPLITGDEPARFATFLGFFMTGALAVITVAAFVVVTVLALAWGTVAVCLCVRRIRKSTRVPVRVLSWISLFLNSIIMFEAVASIVLAFC